MTEIPWLLGKPSRDPRGNPVFCFPNAGGGASIFARWARESPGSLEILGVQPPGRENRLNEPPISDFPLLMDAMWEAIGAYLNQPYVLLGHSMGALLAFEFARKIRAVGGHLPQALWLLSLGPPDTLHTDSLVHRLPDEQLLESVDRRFGGIPAAVREDPEMLRLVLPILRADMTLLEQYEYTASPPLECPIVACGGTEDPVVSEELLAGWQRHTVFPLQQRMFPGGHFFLKEQSAEILSELKESFDNSPVR